MGIQISGQAQGVVLAASQKAGSPAAVSTGWHNELLKSDLLPRYAYLVQSGVVFAVTYASAATAAASATAVGAFCLLNPAGSGKNLVLLDAYFQLGAAPSAGTTPLAVGMVGVNQVPTSQTAGNTPLNMMVGNGNASIAKPLTVGTIAGAGTTTLRQLGSIYFDLAAGDVVSYVKDQIDGAVVIAPGAIVDLVSVSGTPTIIPTLTWAELPV